MNTITDRPNWRADIGAAVHVAAEESTTSTCRTCQGGGEIGTRQDYWGNWETETCRDCRGTGETDDRCSHCDTPTLADELAALDGQDVCLPCLTALTGDDPYAPDNGRDL